VRRAILLAAAVAIVACGGASAERLSGAETCDGINVPTIGTVGDFPSPTGRLVINVRADGTIVCEGRTVGFDALDARLAALDPGGERLNSTAVVLRIDGDLAWGATMQTIMNCATHRIDKIWFCVRHPDDGEEGAIAACLPTDRGSEALPREDPDSYGAIEQRVAVFGREGGSDVAGAYAKLRETRAATRSRRTRTRGGSTMPARRGMTLGLTGPVSAPPRPRA